MKRWISLPLVAPIFIFLNISLAGQLIQWNEAHNYYGQHVTVEGKIVSTYNSGKACFLNFHPDYKKYFTAVIFKSAFHRFPPSPEDFYYGKNVHVTGTIKQYKGKPEIILNDPSQIEIVGEPISKTKVSKVISWKDADKYYGKIVTVEGKVVSTYNSGKACFLNFHRNWKRYFTAVIFASNFHKFEPPPEIKFKAKHVRVTGLVREYKGKPEVIVNNPSQIEIIERK